MRPDGKITSGERRGYRPLIRFSHLSFRKSDDLCLRNLDRLSNYLALLVRRKEGDIRGVASTSHAHDTFDGREPCRIDQPPIVFDVDLDHRPSAVQFAYLYLIAGKAARFLSGDDFGAIFLVCAFKPARDIYSIADHRVIKSEFRSDIADKHVAGIDADAHSERPAAVVGQFRRPKGTLAGE